MLYVYSTELFTSLQYSSMTILVNRHNAGFGNPEGRRAAGAIRSRELCLQHAFRISHMMNDYRKFNGDGSTLVGSALYNVTMAATTFVAEIFEARKESFREEIDGLTICLKTMREMVSSLNYSPKFATSVTNTNSF